MVAFGLALCVTSATLGVDALGQLGFGLLALVLIAVALVRLGKHDLSVSRSVVPERAQAGRDVRVELRLTNEGRGQAPLLLLEDQVPPELSGRARFAIRGIEPKGTRTTAFTLRPSRRGNYAVGPLEITVTDPFGVARVRSSAAGQTNFLAYPRIEPLVLPRDSGTRRTITVSARRQPTGSSGEDFYTLREYVEGDDLRRIHWPATAKRNRYMVRQEETPWHARATVLLDDRSQAFVPSSWERAVEASASVIDLYHRAGYAFRLARSIGIGQRSSRGSDHFHRCLDLLATVESSESTEDVDPFLKRLSELENQANVEGVLIAVTGLPSLQTAQALTRCARRFKMVIAVILPAHHYGSGRSADTERAETATTTLLDRAGVKTLMLSPGDSLATSWSSLWNVWGPTNAATQEVGASGI